MNLLIVAATSFEIQPAIDFWHIHQLNSDKNEVTVLITGIGGIATSYNLTRRLPEIKPGYVIQAGIAGSFRSDLVPGSVVGVNEELIGDLGAEEVDVFNDVFDLGLMTENEPPFTGKILQNPNTDIKNLYGLTPVRSISINEITTRKERIELIRQKYRADIESMEGAAFHYVCLRENIRFLQIRAISNYVGERNKEKWNLGLAIKNLNKTIIEIASTIL